ARAGDFAGCDFFAPAAGLLEVAAHIADAGDAVRHVEWKKILRVPEMDVHVPQPRDEEFTFAIDCLSAFGNCDGGGGTDGCDFLPGYGDGHVRPWRGSGCVYDCDVA